MDLVLKPFLQVWSNLGLIRISFDADPPQGLVE